jgi:hypothetical protein
MEVQHDDLLAQVWRACLGFALSLIAVAVLMVALSAADPTVSQADLKDSLSPESFTSQETTEMGGADTFRH